MRIDERDEAATLRAFAEAGIEYNPDALCFDLQYVVENGADLQDAGRIAERIRSNRCGEETDLY